MNEHKETFYSNWTDDDLGILKNHLRRRWESKKTNESLNVVYDILHQCDIHCVGCGTNALRFDGPCVSEPDLSLSEIELVLDRLKSYSEEYGKTVFLNIGGGEPFLREDILDVLKLASSYFGREGVGVDTNASLDESPELLRKASEYVSYIGISVNGNKNYHNWWAGGFGDPYSKAISTIGELCRSEELAKCIEVTSVSTNKNLSEIPRLMSDLKAIGVNKYSVHRAIPVGRMAYRFDLIPTAKQYLDLLLNMLKVSREIGLETHLHHSIESIHCSLLLGLNTYAPDKVGNPDSGSSLGIEPEGELVFDPWCTTGIWQKLTGGNVLHADFEFSQALESKSGTILDLAQIYTAPHLRCKGCSECCSGGSRIVAAATKLNSVKVDRITTSELFNAMTEVDPACPKYQLRNEV